MPLVALLLAGVLTSQVIAGPPLSDQPPEGRGSLVYPIVVLVLAAASIALLAAFRLPKLRDVPPRPPGLPPWAALAMACLLYVAAPVGAGVARVIFGVELPESDSTNAMSLADLALLSLGGYIAQIAFVGAYVLALSAERRGVDGRPRPGRSWLIAISALLLAWPILVVVGWVAAWIWTTVGGAPPEMIAHATLRELAESPVDWSFWLMSGLVVIAAPVVEEVLYRGLIQDAIVRMGVGRWPAIALTSIVFALMHIDAAAPHAVASLFVLSLAFGWVYERTGRLSAPILMHALFNLSNIVLALAMT